jgi:hypothetical protein
LEITGPEVVAPALGAPATAGTEVGLVVEAAGELEAPLLVALAVTDAVDFAAGPPQEKTKNPTQATTNAADNRLI